MNPTDSPDSATGLTPSFKSTVQTAVKVDGVVYLLFFGMLIFSGLLLFVEHFFPNDGQIFQVVAGLLTGFSGSFFTRIKGSSGGNDKDGK